MKHLRKFNENSHDWRANAFHGAPDEEIDKIIGLDPDRLKDQTERDFHGSKSDIEIKKKTEADLRSAGLPVKEEPKTVEPEVEVEEEKPNVGSRIKNFLGFGKK